MSVSVDKIARSATGRFGSIGLVLTGAALAALAVAVVLGEQGRVPAQRLLDALGIALLLGGSLSVIASQRWPVGAYLISLLSIGAYEALGYDVNSPYFLGTLLTAYRAAAPGQRQRAAMLVLLSVPVAAVGAIVIGRMELALSTPIMVAAAFLAGQIASELRAASTRRAAQARADEQSRMLTEERLRIARELHDVISHSIATIGVQAGVAAHVLDKDPEQAREALLAIKSVTRDAMQDLRGMLGVLRGTDETALREPAPGLDRLPELVARVRGAGVSVGFEIQGQAYPLTPATDLAAYRVVQEALTNIIRHAPGASARVQLRYAKDRLDIEVVDDGTTKRDGDPVGGDGTGHGLVGLRERAATLGGTLEAGPTESGGFRVAGSLPVASTA